MIKRIFVDNYKTLVNFELALDELTLILGPNGSGKTAVLDAVAAVRKLVDGSAKILDEGIFPISTTTRWQEQLVQVVELEVEIDGDSYLYRLEIEHNDRRQSASGMAQAEIVRELLLVDHKPVLQLENGKISLYNDMNEHSFEFELKFHGSAIPLLPDGVVSSYLERFRNYMSNITICGFCPVNFDSESRSPSKTLERDGSNFPSWYWHWSVGNPEGLFEFTEFMRSEVMDGFTTLKLDPVGVDAKVLKAIFLEGKNRNIYDFGELSDGQRALVALYALLFLINGSGGILLVDEPENFLAHREIQPWLQVVEDACGEWLPQIVLCSHHPAVVDYIGAKRVVCLERESSGATRVRKLEFDTSGNEGLRLSELLALGWVS